MNSSIKFTLYNENEIKKCKSAQKRFVCCLCDFVVLSQDILKIHYIKVHDYQVTYKSVEEDQFVDPKDKKKTCHVCFKQFKNAKILSKHVKAVHRHLKPFICNVCSYKSARKSTLYIHLRQHLSDETSKPLNCNECDFRCSDPSVLNKHKKIHNKTTVGKYLCLEKSCNYYAIQSSGLKTHILFKHPELYSKIKCNLCGFLSVNPQRLKTHKDDHEKGLIKIDKKDDAHADQQQKMNSNTNYEISSDCFLPLESTDSITTQSIDTGGVTIVHNHNSSSATIPTHCEDTQF